jgi:hypothetical protein
MITINKGLTNSITIRANDNVTISNPQFLFEFTSVQSRETFLFIPIDLSTTTRYNKFQMYEISGTLDFESLTASTPKVQLTYGGFYNYKVYQVSNYSLSASSVVLDEGKMLYDNGEYDSFAFNC